VVYGYGYGTGDADNMTIPDWWGLAIVAGCCLFVPMTIVLYMVMARAEQLWKDIQWRG